MRTVPLAHTHARTSAGQSGLNQLQPSLSPSVLGCVWHIKATDFTLADSTFLNNAASDSAAAHIAQAGGNLSPLLRLVPAM
eukprot:771464-Prorocentrum_minimum.AAC.1